jgi:dissimilatory sulfite reductase (desulfoviridin) alpha/beta subunit
MEPIITTEKDICRRCYSCVRLCPAKAIRVLDGQADVMDDRCLSCGNCVRVCSQGAKKVIDNIVHVRELLHGGNVVALLAPSFPAAFPEWRPGQVIRAFRSSDSPGCTKLGLGLIW